MHLQAIAFDADDTLWHNETIFSMTQQKFFDMLAAYCDREEVERRLYETEVRNLKVFGYGVKGFTLAMIETAIEVTNGRIPARDIQRLIDFGREMLAAPVELLPGVERVIATLANRFPLLVITKGDLFDQETKIARSGLAGYFQHIEVVSEKTPEAYRAILQEHGIAPQHFLMVGNSLRSDIVPVLEIGGYAVHIPYHITWQHEQAERPTSPRYAELEDIRELPRWLDQQGARFIDQPTHNEERANV
ncbi:MAG: HAD family hydrolase [Ardenticatenia bacterium]|nr:MAG: HAD family hydrolase [Ardenticatenia bacterium]